MSIIQEVIGAIYGYIRQQQGNKDNKVGFLRAVIRGNKFPVFGSRDLDPLGLFRQERSLLCDVGCEIRVRQEFGDGRCRASGFGSRCDFDEFSVLGG